MTAGIECALTGRLGRDPECKHVKGGSLAMLSFALAVDEGQRADGATWVRVVVFGDRADELAGGLAKGDRAYVEGKLSLDHWTGNDGAEKSGLSVVASLVQPLGKIGNRRPRQARGNGRTGTDQPRQHAVRQPVNDPGRQAPFDDPIGF